MTEPTTPVPPARPALLLARWPWLAAVAVALVLVTAWAISRRQPVPAEPMAPTVPVQAALPPVLAETMGEEGHLAIAVVSLDRVANDTVELRLAVTNTSAAGAPGIDLAQRFSADGPDRGTLAEVYLADLAHERKFFVLRDGKNEPLGSRDVTPLAAGERRVLWARYPAPRDEDAEVVIHVPHAEPMPNVPVGIRSPSTDSGSPSPP
ncbi:MAG TPA: hypothetical protein VMF13_12910 [Luteitalea sp.]|nr:hypothetical protein [Luteitalea sp.]